MTTVLPTLRETAASGPSVDRWTYAFLALFGWRYIRQIVHLVSFWALYKPAEPAAEPTLTSGDATVIVPTVDPGNAMFGACLTTACRNRPSRVLVVTAGETLRRLTEASCADTPIEVLVSTTANKRAQVVRAVQATTSRIVVLMDDHVLWPDTFLRYALAAFDADSRVGLVGTNKRVIRRPTAGASLWERHLNLIQCLYLERHNFEIRASNAVDGGVFVVSGRTSLLRTEIVADPAFCAGYLNDHIFFGRVGPLSVDDDNFVTRWCVAHGWKIKIQYRPETLITTDLGSLSKFTGGLIRWVRTTWRSNAMSLVHWHVWRAQPWSVYAVYLTLFTNFALFYDPLLLYAFYRSGFVQPGALLPRPQQGTHPDGSTTPAVAATAAPRLLAFVPLVLWMLAFKMVKPFAYFYRHPQDLVLVPGYFLFTWFHSLIKLCGLLTVHNGKWEGRDLDAINKAIKMQVKEEEDDDE
ncbi:capsule polysaccharide synthase [Niveomyces insectorum RCEF 264]|uniref:Capsule polysaccharide synthase n=1 Tax=Niveomyces insectorum RCEF 264 TaxID=1081102 RepID=A0A162MEE5_9HYPO|nr:capsule polysaccharide synthase [Niveomyces insectorum RCEF 264]